MILVDTSCWIEFFRPDGSRAVQAELKRWLAADRVAICGPVRAELLRGTRKPDVVRVSRALSALHHLETLDEDWHHVALHARTLADTAQHVPLVDLLIAVVAHRHGAAVAHLDRHCQQIGRVLSVELHDLGDVRGTVSP
ncbi:MAG: PIN domain nuclease [Deltaproteobacteria bacterium]|nr:PIN domain nuclease [Deltaproteobacteria bacterium]